MVMFATSAALFIAVLSTFTHSSTSWTNTVKNALNFFSGDCEYDLRVMGVSGAYWSGG